tara:strand:- start:2181 stop:2483 length:303 start_codon:yes stop_codon:yes gene_type:complete
VIIDFEKEKRKRYYPKENGFYEYVEIIVPIRKDEKERRYLGTDCTFITNSDFFYEQMKHHEVKVKFSRDMKIYFEGWEEELTEVENGGDLIINHIDGVKE